MTFNVNNTAMNLVYVNNTRMSVVNVDGTEVYRADAGNVTLVSTGSSTFSPGLEDVNRCFVVVTTNMRASVYNTPGPVPTINGVSCSVIINESSAANDDGGRAGIFAIKIPTGTGTFTVGNTTDGTGTPNFAVYRMVGVLDPTVAYSTNFNKGQNTITVSTPASGCAFVGVVKDFNTVTGISNSNPDLTYIPNSGNDSQGIGANRSVTSPSITFGGYGQLNVAASFSYAY